MATEKRLIDANAIEYPEYFYESEEHEDPFIEGFRQGKIDAISSIRALAPTVDAVEVVHSRFVRIADFGDGEGCFGYCERCGTIHHSQSPVALKADYRWCRWCGAKMDGW